MGHLPAAHEPVTAQTSMAPTTVRVQDTDCRLYRIESDCTPCASTSCRLAKWQGWCAPTSSPFVVPDRVTAVTAVEGITHADPMCRRNLRAAGVAASSMGQPLRRRPSTPGGPRVQTWLRDAAAQHPRGGRTARLFRSVGRRRTRSCTSRVFRAATPGPYHVRTPRRTLAYAPYFWVDGAAYTGPLQVMRPAAEGIRGLRLVRGAPGVAGRRAARSCTEDAPAAPDPGPGARVAGDAAADGSRRIRAPGRRTR